MRQKSIEVQFRNKNNENRIVSALKTTNVNHFFELNNQEDYFDFAEVGYKLGVGKFIDPLKESSEKQQDESMSIENILKRIDEKSFFNKFLQFPVSDDKEIDFISSHFSELCRNKEFIEWSVKEENEERVEKIVNNNKMKMANEDELLTYLIEIDKCTHRFHRLFSKVHFKLCTGEAYKKYIENFQKEEGIHLIQCRKVFLESIKDFIEIQLSKIKERNKQIETVNQEKKEAQAMNNIMNREKFSRKMKK